MARPVDIVRKLCPHARPAYVQAFEQGDALFAAHGITTPARLAHFLAQCFHESGGLTLERESGNYSAPRIEQIFGVGHHSAAVTHEEAVRLAGDGPALFERVYGLGNPRKAVELGNNQPGDGWKYRGNGILQTTGRGNHRRMGEKCGVDFEASPDLVTSAAHALKPALAEWTEGNLNAFADADDILTITRRINGGTNGLAQRKDWLARIKPLVATVDLKTVPAAAPEPPAAIPRPAPAPSAAPAPQGPSATPKAAGAAAAGTAAGAAAAKAGLDPWLIVAVVLAAALIGALVVHFIANRKG